MADRLKTWFRSLVGLAGPGLGIWAGALVFLLAARVGAQSSGYTLELIDTFPTAKGLPLDFLADPNKPEPDPYPSAQNGTPASSASWTFPLNEPDTGGPKSITGIKFQVSELHCNETNLTPNQVTAILTGPTLSPNITKTVSASQPQLSVVCPKKLEVVGNIGSILATINNQQLRLIGPAIATTGAGTDINIEGKTNQGTIQKIKQYSQKIKAVQDFAIERVNSLVTEVGQRFSNPNFHAATGGNLNPDQRLEGGVWIYEGTGPLTIDGSFSGRGSLVITGPQTVKLEGSLTTNNNLKDFSLGVISLSGGQITISNPSSSAQIMRNIGLFAPYSTISFTSDQQLGGNSDQALLLMVAKLFDFGKATGTIVYPTEFKAPGFERLLVPLKQETAP